MARGFSLLELLVVLAISAALVAMASAQFSRLSSLVQLKAAAREVAATLRQARSRAIAEQRETTLVLDARARRFPEVALELVVGQAQALGEHAGAIRFFPDGSSTGARVRLLAKGRMQVVDVDWLTGRVVIREP